MSLGERRVLGEILTFETRLKKLTFLRDQTVSQSRGDWGAVGVSADCLATVCNV